MTRYVLDNRATTFVVDFDHKLEGPNLEQPEVEAGPTALARIMKQKKKGITAKQARHGRWRARKAKSANKTGGCVFMRSKLKT